MNILFDVNIWVDTVVRSNTFPSSRSILLACQNAGHQIYVPGCGYTTIYYIISQYLTQAGSKEYLSNLILQNNILLAPFTDQTVILANQINLTDFEDSCIAASASLSRCKLIITRDKKCFRGSPVTAMTPEKALKELF